MYAFPPLADWIYDVKELDPTDRAQRQEGETSTDTAKATLTVAVVFAHNFVQAWQLVLSAPSNVWSK